jgi:tRNA(fMet)-specific endonuclease VapC
MLILDTDLISIVLRKEGADYNRLIQRLPPSEVDEVRVTIVSFEEHARGWLAKIAQTKEFVDQVKVYGRLQRLVRFYGEFEVLAFDDKAAECCQELRHAKIRVGTMDLKIGAIALSHDATLITRNLRDFQKIPGLRVEDWLRST